MGRVRVDAELRPLGLPGTVVTLSKDIPLDAVWEAAPGDEEAPTSVGRHHGLPLASRRIGVDLELGPHRRAGAVVALAEDIERAVESPGDGPRLPDHDEVAARVRGDPGLGLVARRRGVDKELGALRGARGIVALAEDAESAAVAVAHPHHDEP